MDFTCKWHFGHFTFFSLYNQTILLNRWHYYLILIQCSCILFKHNFIDCNLLTLLWPLSIKSIIFDRLLIIQFVLQSIYIRLFIFWLFKFCLKVFYCMLFIMNFYISHFYSHYSNLKKNMCVYYVNLCYIIRWGLVICKEISFFLLS